MIDSSMKVWLLEVNSSPSMDKSNTVLTEMIKEMSEDYIKVIVDKTLNNTGKFKLFKLGKEYGIKNVCQKEYVLKGKIVKEKYLKKI